jgi:hypothetical protein
MCSPRATARTKALWFESRLDVAKNAWGARAWTPGFQYPYLWAIERYGGLTNQPKLGGRDWYAEGAEWLIEGQLPGGDWGKTEDTCFALLFLRRATVTEDEGVGAFDDALARPVKPAIAYPAADSLRITDWLAAGPWTDRDFGTLLAKPPFDPAKEKPREGANVAKKPWRRIALKADGWSNLDEVLATECDRGIVALATSIEWTHDEPLEAVLWFDIEDGYDLYLDGARVANDNRAQGPIDNSVRVPVSLARGKHSLVCVVEDALGSAVFGARICGDDGKRLADPPSIAAGPPPKATKR